MAVDVRIAKRKLREDLFSRHPFFTSIVLWIITFTFSTQICNLFYVHDNHIRQGLETHSRKISKLSPTKPKEEKRSPELKSHKRDTNQYYDVVFGVVSNSGLWNDLESMASAYDTNIQKFNIYNHSTRVIFFACHDQNEVINRFEGSTTVRVKIQCDDSYDGLLNKTRAIRKWVLKTISFAYLVKVDDDVVINMNRLFSAVHFLKQEHLQRLYAGDMRVVPVEIDPKSKWSDLDYASVQSIYPLYANGYFYILSYDLVKLLVNMENTGPKMRKSRAEDVFVGMMLMLAQNVSYVPMGYHKMLLNKPCNYQLHNKAWAVICHTRPTPKVEKRLEVWKKTCMSVEAKQNQFKESRIWNQLLQ